MKTLDGEFIYEMDSSHEPVLEIDPGETVKVETLDAFGGQIKSKNDTLADLDMAKVNPATGPIYINSAKPGDTLAVEIKDIEVKSPGVQGIVPGFGFLSNQYDEPLVTIHEITEAGINFGDLVLPIQPMIGTIGVAPEGEGVPCNTPGKHGGNLDTPDVRAGVTLLLPVFHEGGLFSLGDGHALQGDGEVCGVSIEVATSTTLKIESREKSIPTPMIDSEEEFITLGSAEQLEDAGRIALKAMIAHIVEETSLSSVEAYKLCSVASDLKVSQVVNPLKTVRVSISKDYL
ncbi:acetamidase/formamidase family protein [Candidatus Bipolaricaulota bacterium]|nr:acetamidase/formamidase family protein [Candidatus Bipolaricaulota bacterium]